MVEGTCKGSGFPSGSSKAPITRALGNLMPSGLRGYGIHMVYITSRYTNIKADTYTVIKLNLFFSIFLGSFTDFFVQYICHSYKKAIGSFNFV